VRVLELTELYPPDIGGTQRHVARQAEELTRRGHEVTVLTHAVGDSEARELTPEGITVLRTSAPWLSRLPGFMQNPRQRYSPPAPEPKTVRLIRKLIKDQRPDVILAHNWLIYSYLTFKRDGDPPVIWILHDYSGVCHKRNLLYVPPTSTLSGQCPGPRLDRCIPCGRLQYGWAKSAMLATSLDLSRRLLHSRIDQVVAVSSAVATLSQLGFPRPIKVIPTFLGDGLREVAFTQPRPSFCPDGDFLLFVGSLSKHKGVDVLLEAHKGLKPRVPLLVLAAASSRRDLHVPDEVTVVLDVDHNEVMAAWAHCTMGVVPSVWEEPWGQVAAEAATVGKPVVASRVGGLQDLVVDGQTGILVPPNDPEALTAAINLLMASPDLRRTMGQNAMEHVRPFTVSVVTDQIEQAMQDAILSRQF
jgi:glycosyltransferase involved in cell wall biosynthesis